jgi:hypothetical protein
MAFVTVRKAPPAPPLGVAITECVAIVRLHRPQLAYADARRMVARMLAEEPTL